MFTINLNAKQLEAVHTNEHDVVVLSVAASGKTACITERAKYLLSQGIDPKSIVVITFTNAAADEMQKRIGNSEMFIGTVHSYACRLLVQAGINVFKYIQEEKFEKLFSEVNKHPECIVPVEHLIVDEIQDSDELQFSFFEQISPKNFFFVGDLRQSIYGWAGARPDLLQNVMARRETVVYELDQNYRNAPEILDFARHIISKLGHEFFDDSYAMADYDGRVIRSDYSPATIYTAITRYGGEPRDWFVCCRKNDQVAEVVATLTKKGVPCSTFKRGDLSAEEFRTEMEKNTVKVLTIHSAKGLEAKNVVAVVGNGYNDEEIRLQYVAATRAKELLVWMPYMVPRRKKAAQKSAASW